ncbi:polysaccharide lyase 6 family protein [uncultured Maricaulis sp.]|uniref:polysaccharide lyase 6 family protein n=1 Tax=uncultured Maricaulis sp. TaxID=174710 RepID=UPI0025D5830B|nr:polysaccharide lyase 6 family protein [uncultured Maricaulis sp.]
MTRKQSNGPRILRGAVALLVAVFVWLPGIASASDFLVTDQQGYQAALERAEPGDRIVLANGVWEDFEIVFEATGTADAPIYLMAETPGDVVLTGQSNLRIGGEHLVVWGLTFRDGYSPTSEVISFRRDSQTLANHTRLVETVIENYNQPDRETQDSWVVVYGQENRIDRNAFVGKTNRGPTMVVRLNSEGSQNNNHVIEHNYFGPRAPLGGNGGETLRIGVSAYSRINSGTIVRQNYFDRCDGEVEIISIKSEGNLITENVFYESRGSVVFRHGGRNEVSRNVFFGNGVPDTGGIRVINDNQVVRDNYLEGLRGRKFLGALVVMNGVPNSPENRYHQVDGALISNNSFVDVLELGFAVGSDEERSAVPVNSEMTANILLSDENEPVAIFDDVSGISFSGNISNNRRFDVIGSTAVAGFSLERAENGLVYMQGEAVDGGAGAPRDLQPVARNATGPRYYEKPSQGAVAGDVIEVEANEAELLQAIADAEPGDTILVSPGEIAISSPIEIAAPIAIAGSEGVRLTSASDGLFRLLAGADLTLRNVTLHQASAETALLHAAGEQYRGAYRLNLEDVALTTDRDDSVGPLLGADQATFAQIVTIARLQVADWPGSIIELSGDGLDGWYLADEVRIEDSHFSGLADGLARFGREGRDESTFGPRFSLTGSRLEAVAEGGVALALNGIDQLHVTDNRIVASGSFEIRRRVLGWPFEIGANDVDETVSLTLRGVDGEPVDATLAGGAQ